MVYKSVKSYVKVAGQHLPVTNHIIEPTDLQCHLCDKGKLWVCKEIEQYVCKQCGRAK